MLMHLRTSWTLNIKNSKLWFSQVQKRTLKVKSKTFSLVSQRLSCSLIDCIIKCIHNASWSVNDHLIWYYHQTCLIRLALYEKSLSTSCHINVRKSSWDLPKKWDLFCLSYIYRKLRIKIVDLNFFEPLLTGIQFHKLCLPGTTIYNIPRKKYCVVNY